VSSDLGASGSVTAKGNTKMNELENEVRRFNALREMSELDFELKRLSRQLGYSSCLLLTIDDTGDLPAVQDQVGPVTGDLRLWLAANLELLNAHIKNRPAPLILSQFSNHTIYPNTFALSLGSSNVQRAILLVEVAGEATSSMLEKLSWFWMIAGHYALEAFNRCVETGTIPFTKREVECIRWVSKGKTSWEVSKILGVSERTVNFHIQNCMKKTNSVNRQQVISKCLLSGVI